VKSKNRIIMYSGHCETVGGDARYFFDLISRIDKKNFKITSFTDKNIVFEKRLAQWTTPNSVEVEYLETNPPLFKDESYLLFVNKIIKYFPFSENHNTISIVKKILIKILKILTFKEIIDEYKNAKLFKLTIKQFGSSGRCRNACYK